jgi:inorganic pyrophosphatase/exopolyphosphatase
MKKEILVTSNVNPDLDGFACVFAYAYFLNKIGNKAIPSISGKHHEEADHVISEYGLNLDIKEENPQEYNKIVIVDASGLDCLDKRTDPDDVIEIIDHRKVNLSEQFVNAKAQIELVGAAATLVAEKYQENAVAMPKDIATLVYGAIISNTLNFQAKVATDRDREIAVWLKRENNFPDDFAHKMFLSKSDLSGQKLIQVLHEDFAGFTGHNFGSYKLGTAQIEMIGGKELVLTRKPEIIIELKKIMADQNLNFVFLTIIDLEANQNIIVAPTQEIEQILSKVLNATFIDQVAIRPGLIMRKEIVPLLKEEFINLSQKGDDEKN